MRLSRGFWTDAPSRSAHTAYAGSFVKLTALVIRAQHHPDSQREPFRIETALTGLAPVSDCNGLFSPCLAFVAGQQRLGDSK